MTARGLIFSGESVRAIQAGLKWETRRIVKPQPTINSSGVYADLYNHGPEWAFWLPDNRMTEPRTWPCPHGVPGEDSIYVKEAWGVSNIYDSMMPRDIHPGAGVAYPATGGVKGVRIRSPLFMPKWASRITRQLEAVRIERVQEISETDALAEGCVPNLSLYSSRAVFFSLWNSMHTKPKPVRRKGQVDHYVSYPWEDIQETREHRGRPWHVMGNPWVWCLTLSREESK
jgi:hypothetical protein